MKRLFLLTESDDDDLFFESLAENVSGHSFEVDRKFRIRKGGGSGAVKRATGNLIRFLEHHHKDDCAFFLVATDNDRVSDYPDNFLPSSKKHSPNRYRLILDRLRDGLGESPGDWPFRGAIAVPIEALESWLLLASTELGEANLPTHPLKSASQPEPGFKDLVAKLTGELGQTYQEFVMDTGGRLDTGTLESKSKSFSHLVSWLKQWA